MTEEVKTTSQNLELQERIEFQKKYPYGKADYIDFYAAKGVRRSPEKIQDEITHLLNIRGGNGYEFAGKFEIPPEPEQAQGAVSEHGVMLIFKKTYHPREVPVSSSR